MTLSRSDMTANSPITESDRAMLLARYNERLDRYGYDPRTLGWPKRRHRLRYDILLSQWDFDGATLLDFGCGFGDLYEYLNERDIHAVYEGIDINSSLIAKGSQVHPQARLTCLDAFEDGFTRDYDYIVASGLHNTKLENNEAFVDATFALFAAHARCGFAMNFLSAHADFEQPDAYHEDPCRVLRLAYQYSKRVVLRNDYMPFEFTVFVDLRSAFDPKLAVYPPYLATLSGQRPTP